MSEKKYGTCPECGAPCEVIEGSYKEELHDVHYVEHKYDQKTGAVWVKAFCEEIQASINRIKAKRDKVTCLENIYHGYDLDGRELAALTGILTKLEKNINESAPAGREEDAVAFAEWCAINNWVLRNDKTTWHWGPIGIPKKEWIVCTSSELYIKFKQQKEK